MTIDSVNGLNSGVYGVNTNSLKNKYKDSTTDASASKSQKSDKLELSVEAKKISEIRSRIESGFYDNADVLKEVAVKLEKDIYSKQ